MGTLISLKPWKAATTVLVVGGLSACATSTYYVPAGTGREAGLMRVTGSFSERALRHYVADFDPAMLALARVPSAARSNPAMLRPEPRQFPASPPRMMVGR